MGIDINTVCRWVRDYRRKSHLLSYSESKRIKQATSKVDKQDAIVRNLEVIGEAVKKIPDDVRDSHRDIPWKKIAELRDILIHEYFGINLNIVWDVIENKLQPLKAATIKLYEDYN